MRARLRNSNPRASERDVQTELDHEQFALMNPLAREHANATKAHTENAKCDNFFALESIRFRGSQGLLVDAAGSRGSLLKATSGVRLRLYERVPEFEGRARARAGSSARARQGQQSESWTICAAPLA
mgnify:CR=1 FL=1